MKYKFEYLCVPLDGATVLDLPYTIYDSLQYKVVLQEFNAEDLEKAFRLRFESGEQPGSYRIVHTDPHDYFIDENIAFALHERQLQLRVIPKTDGGIDEALKERLSIGLECALGFFDEYVSWVHNRFSTVASRGAYRSHKSARRIGAIGEREVEVLRIFWPTRSLSGCHAINSRHYAPC